MILEIEKSSHLKGEQCTIYYNIQKNKSVEKSQTGSPDHRQIGQIGEDCLSKGCYNMVRELVYCI